MKKCTHTHIYIYIYTHAHNLESNPHTFYSFRGLKNQMRIRFRIRFAVESWILEKMIEPLYVP